MRYFVIFLVTLVLALIILFYNPFLGVYKNNVTIEYDFNEEGYSWSYDIKGESLKIKEEENNKYTFDINKNGVTEITFYYKNDDSTKYDIYYKFRVLGKRIFWVDGIGHGLLNYPNPY